MARRLKPHTDLAVRIIEARGALDRDEFATMLGVAKSTLSNWEQGAIIPPLDKLRAIRRHAGVSYEWLIDGEGEMRPGQELSIPPVESAPAVPAQPPYHRALMHALIRMYFQKALELNVKLTADELADKVLAQYDRSIDDVIAMEEPTEKVA